VDADGKPEVAVRRGEQALKSVPAKLRKAPEIKALTARAAELRRQGARIRLSLEQAMVRGERLTGDELARYREHLLLWPALSRLVLVGDGTCGYPDRDGRVLRDHAGEQQAIGDSEQLRIAHPLDLLERGDWPDWQRDVLSRRLAQPFKQVFRELYVPVGSERTEAGGSRRYAGHQVQPGRARALLSGRGWRIDEDEGRAEPTITSTSQPLCGSSTASAARPTSSRPGSRRSASRARVTAATSSSKRSRPACSARSCATSTSSSA
jgi:hypothetical protein